MLGSRAEELARVALANIEREFPHYEPLLQTERRPAERPPRATSTTGDYAAVEHWLAFYDVLLLTAEPVRQ